MQLAKNQHPSKRWVLIFAARVPQRTRGSTVRQFRAQDRRRYEIPTVLAEGQNNCRDGTEAAKPPEYSRTPLHEKTPSIRMAFFLCRSRNRVRRGRCPHRPKGSIGFAEDFCKNRCILPGRCRHRPLRIARLTFHMWELLHAAPFLCALTIAQQARIVYNARKDIYYSIKRRNA